MYEIRGQPSGYRPPGGRSEHAVSTRTACSHFARFARIRPQPPLACLAARSRFAARLACSARFARPPRLCWPALSLRSRLPPHLLASLALRAARFARPASPAARSARRLSSCPPSFRSGHFSSALRSPPRLLCSRFALQLACCSLRSPPRLRLASLAAGCSACCSLLVRRLPARSARPSHSPCPLRLLQRLISDGQGGQWTGSICGIDVTEA